MPAVVRWLRRDAWSSLLATSRVCCGVFMRGELSLKVESWRAVTELSEKIGTRVNNYVCWVSE